MNNNEIEKSLTDEMISKSQTFSVVRDHNGFSFWQAHARLVYDVRAHSYDQEAGGLTNSLLAVHIVE